MNVCRWSAPIAVIGIVVEFGLTKIFEKTAKFASGFSSFDFVEALRRGHVPDPVGERRERVVFVVRYLTSSQAASRFLPPSGCR